MIHAASLRRDFARASLTNAQRTVLEGSTVFRDTELGSLMDDSEAAGFEMALLAQVSESIHFTTPNHCPAAECTFTS